jgi:hypothetical protein
MQKVKMPVDGMVCDQVNRWCIRCRSKP